MTKTPTLIAALLGLAWAGTAMAQSSDPMDETLADLHSHGGADNFIGFDTSDAVSDASRDAADEAMQAAIEDATEQAMEDAVDRGDGEG